LASLGVEIALIDGTFWSSDELAGRNQDKVPHPPVSKTLEMLGPRQENDPEIYFIHLNHTNPLYNSESEASALLVASGWSIARQGQTFSL
jgi:pyrroloquinoline quinone biosynthesis protein B